MNVSAWCIRNPVPAIVFFVMMTLAGFYAFSEMKVQNFPDIDLPIITVTASLPGAAPSQMETEVARKLENAFANIQDLKHIYTKVYDGSVIINVEFRLEKPLQEALDDVRSAVDKVRSDLPQNLSEPVARKVDLASTPVLAFTVRSAHRDAEALSWFVDNDLTKQLLAIKGVGAVSRVGGVSREITVALDPVRLSSLKVSPADISRQLAAINIERAGGKAEIGSEEQPLRTRADQADAAAIARLPLTLPDGRAIRLEQLATISDHYAKPEAAAFLDGKPVIGFEITRSRGASEVDVGSQVRAKIAALSASQNDLQFTESFDFVTPVVDEFHASMLMLYEGALLAVLVVWLFLRDLRATLISAIALPLAAIPAFFAMNQMGFTINVVTLLALSLVIGILVDDAIVEVENIVRHLRMGKTPYQAAMEAADEIGLAVIATTFTLIAVFLPTSFMPGVVGRVFRNFGWTAVFAIFASLLVARMLTPMMAAYLLRPLAFRESHSDSAPSHSWRQRCARWWRRISAPSEHITWMPAYLAMVRWSLKHRNKVFALAGLFFMGSLLLIGLLSKGFIPPDDNSQTQVYLELPPGAALAETDATSEYARQLLMRVPHVQSIYTTIGGGAAGSDPFAAGRAETRKATLTLQLDSRNMRPPKQQIEQEIRKAMLHLPGVRSKVGLGGSGEKFQLALASSDPEQLARSAQAVERDLRGIPGIGNIDSSASLTRTEINVIPDLARAADLGVTSAAIADTLRIATRGDYDNQLAKLNLASRQVPIVVRLADSGFHDLAMLEHLWVPGARGPVLLGQVARLEFGGGPSVIERLDRDRSVTFTAELAGIPLGDVQSLVDTLPSIKNLPSGVRRLEIGDAEAQAEMMTGFALAMLTGLLCIYAVLVLLFRAFLHPITILAALPLAFGGAFAALLLTGKMLSMSSLIGLLMLMGVSTKNSILLVDYAIEARRRLGLTTHEALLDACAKRARPIIMTSLAMGVGMLPVAIGVSSSDPSFRAPMAITVIGGLVTSTLLSLLVIPPLFSFVEDSVLVFRKRHPT